MKRLLIVDASSFVYRAFHSTPRMINADRIPVGAVQGFTGMMMRLMRPKTLAYPHDHAVVVFEKSGNTFRHKIHSGYKAGRTRDPDLMSQFPLCRDIVRAFGIAQIEASGCEADDVIASYAAQCPFDTKITIASPDKDLMQVMEYGSIDVLDTMAKPEPRLRTPADIERLFGPGLEPWQLSHVQALCGDPVDKVPGVAGIGEKTAAALVARHGTLEKVLAAPDDGFPTPRIAKLVRGGAEAARMSYALVRLDSTMQVLPVSHFLRNPVDGRALCDKLMDLRLQSAARFAAREYGVDL